MNPMTTSTRSLLAQAAEALRLPASALDRITIEGEGELPSAFAVTDVAAASIGAAAVALRQLLDQGHDATPELRIDRRLASLWFDRSAFAIGWAPQPAWDPIAGDYAAADGWIRLHTNAPHHRRAALDVLGCAGDRPSVAAAVAGWSAQALESAVVARGGAAAMMRDTASWRAHPQGLAVAAEPLIDWRAGEPGTDGAVSSPWRPRRDRPLAGLKVLDLTRVIAGPVATRYLAGYGAEVLRIDPPGWDEEAILPESTLGKSCARLDLRRTDDRAVFERLLSKADILVHGYRPGALDALDYPEAVRARLRPGLIEVVLDAYGWTGPWRERRGFDSLMQMSTGIAHRGMSWKGAAHPVPLPVQALDHATGYLMAAAALRALAWREAGAGPRVARLSLARTAFFLLDPAGREGAAGAPIEALPGDYAAATEPTAWGPVRRLANAASIAGIAQCWTKPARRLGSSPACWAEARE
jgi:crotonobetainyl-CoA:carnitine CoA-transferase CaiB-like acyl-CoA transferase